jgi:hypothetical protein
MDQEMKFRLKLREKLAKEIVNITEKADSGDEFYKGQKMAYENVIWLSYMFDED